MSVDIRYPNITGLSEKEQLAQIKSYLYQLVDQLNYALPNLGGSTQTYNVQGSEVSYYELRSLIISTTGELRDQYEKLYKSLETDYTSKEEFQDNAEVVDAKLRALGDLADSLAAEDEAIKQSINDLSAVVNAIRATADGLVTKVEELEDSIKSIADFVSEVGTSGGWTYKKWQGGTCELIGTFSLTTTSSTAVGSMFCSEEFLVPTPFAIDTAVVSGSADGAFMITNGGVNGGNNISFALLRPEAFGAETNVVVNLYVVGTYNPGGIE